MRAARRTDARHGGVADAAPLAGSELNGKLHLRSPDVALCEPVVLEARRRFDVEGLPVHVDRIEPRLDWILEHANVQKRPPRWSVRRHGLPRCLKDPCQESIVVVNLDAQRGLLISCAYTLNLGVLRLALLQALQHFGFDGVDAVRIWL